MSNDKELLELAAKAAGITFDASLSEDFGLANWDANSTSIIKVNWNPLEDDGDALRLAVKLGMCVTLFLKSEPNAAMANSCTELTEDDPYAATRRAITRAAAEIGKAMKEK